MNLINNHIKTTDLKNTKWIFLISLISFFVFFTFNTNFYTSLGLSLCVYLFVVYIDRLGKSLPVIELMLLTASFQWILGAYLAYLIDFEHFKYFMYVEEPVYMSIVVPGMLCFTVGSLLFLDNYQFHSYFNKLREIANKYPKMAYFIILLGIAIPFIQSYLPPSLFFIAYLFSNLKYVGISLLLFRDNSKQKWVMFFLIMGLTLLASLRTGMFHDLLLWSALMFSFLAIHLKLKNWSKILFITLGLFFAFLLQGIKGEYREIVENTDNQKGNVDLFYSMLAEQFRSLPEFMNEAYLGMINVRLNQGWIISAIYNNVPQNEPFAEGETIKDAVFASLVPRFLDPDKARAGGQVNFERFTGLFLSEGTSMGTSILGEAYANYGKEGSWLFMFLWGMLISFSYRGLMKLTSLNPLLLLFIPLIFLQVIKSETELVVVLNHLVKASIFSFGILYLINKFFIRKIKKYISINPLIPKKPRRIESFSGEPSNPHH